jgi:hypothetical protein
MIRVAVWNSMDHNATGSSIPRVCGLTDVYCIVELDATGEGKPECCNSDNNPTCAKCLGFCEAECSKKNVGVESCFMEANSTSPLCQCSQFLPTCYDLKRPTMTTVRSENAGGGNTIFYMVIFGVILVLIAGAVHFAHKVA